MKGQRKRNRPPERDYENERNRGATLRLKKKPRCFVINCDCEKKDLDELIMYDCERWANWACPLHVVEVDEDFTLYYICQICNNEELGRRTKEGRRGPGGR